MSGGDRPSSWRGLLLQLDAERDEELSELWQAIASETTAIQLEKDAWVVQEELLSQLHTRALDEVRFLRWQTEQRERTLQQLQCWSNAIRSLPKQCPPQPTDPPPDSPARWSISSSTPPPLHAKRTRSPDPSEADDTTQLSCPKEGADRAEDSAAGHPDPPGRLGPWDCPDSLQGLWDSPQRSPIRQFKYRAVVRKKAAREDLKGHACQKCAAFYAGAARELELLQGASRHRFHRGHTPPATPQGFWDLQFFSSAASWPDSGGRGGEGENR
eukprot:GGOE01041097.1.p1 GENE.GGOE01041097.1~~GGOE01041097.1.p1  ORF type:complete len:271 (+),score=31.89 GGOE01041097.1:48-860(+)